MGAASLKPYLGKPWSSTKPLMKKKSTKPLLIHSHDKTQWEKSVERYQKVSIVIIEKSIEVLVPKYWIVAFQCHKQVDDGYITKEC